MQVLYNMLDLAAVDAWILFKEVNNKTKTKRRDFIMQLACELRAEYTCATALDGPLSRHSLTQDYVQPADQVLFCKNLANVDIVQFPDVEATQLHTNVQSATKWCVIHVERQATENVCILCDENALTIAVGSVV